MTPGDRFKKWLEGLSASWKDQLRGWSNRAISEGVRKFTDNLEPGMIDMMTETLTKIKDYPNLPPEAKTMIDKSLKEGNIFNVSMGWLFSIIGLLFALLSRGGPLGRTWTYQEDYALRSHVLDPAAVITAWRRDPEKYNQYFEDLRFQGWSDERIEALKFYTLYYPSPAELVHWTAREVFEPTMVEKYGLMDGADKLKRDLFYKAGMDDDQINNHWIAHWEHASWMQIIEMLHRGLITEKDVEEWFPLVEMAPHWAQLLIQTAYTWPTRVDVRRWWDMRTISEVRLRELYAGMGYRGKNLDDYVLWTKVYTAYPDLIARMTKGWINPEDVKEELERLGMPPERVREMMETKIAAEKPARTASDRDLTKTEIYKGVKKNLISWEQGIELLQDLGYDYDEADYILTINVEALEGSPETFEEFKNITQKYKLATGKEKKPMTDELKKAGEELVRITADVKLLEEAVAAEKRNLGDFEVLPVKATVKLKELEVTMNRTKAELFRAQNEYNTQLAIWRRG